jgi:hypothetical protein
MPDRVAYPLFVLATGAMVALALVWPQGTGARSPGPFGHPLAPIQPPVAISTDPATLIGLAPPTAAPPAAPQQPNSNAAP